MNSTEQLQQELDGMIGLYRDVIDGIVRTEEKLNRSRALLNLTIARMVDYTGNADEVATLIGQTPDYVKNAISHNSGETVT